MTQVAEMSDANIIDPKNKDRILASLHSLALVMVSRDDIDRYVADSRGDFLPILPPGSEAVQDDRIPLRHVNVTVCAVLMTGRHDMLRFFRPAQVAAGVGVGENASPFAGSNLKGGVPKPLDLYAWAVGCRQPERRPADDLHFVAETEDARREGGQY